VNKDYEWADWYKDNWHKVSAHGSISAKDAWYFQQQKLDTLKEQSRIMMRK